MFDVVENEAENPKNFIFVKNYFKNASSKDSLIHSEKIAIVVKNKIHFSVSC